MSVEMGSEMPTAPTAPDRAHNAPGRGYRYDRARASYRRARYRLGPNRWEDKQEMPMHREQGDCNS